MTKDEIQAALDQAPKDYNYTTEYLLEWFYHHQKTVIAALEAQLTKIDKNVTCDGYCLDYISKNFNITRKAK